jgi:hypothetical protein
VAKEKSNVTNMEVIEIPKTEERVIEVTIAGNQMLQNNMKEKDRKIIKGDKAPRYKEDYSKKSESWAETGHYDPEARLGFPAEGFMKAMSVVLKSVDLSKKKLFKGKNDLFRALHVESDAFNRYGAGIIHYTKGTPEMGEHWGSLQGRTPIPLYRTLVKDWEMNLRIIYDETWMTHHDVLLLVQAAGRRIGVGAYRIEKGGEYGGFNVKSARFLGLKIAA